MKNTIIAVILAAANASSAFAQAAAASPTRIGVAAAVSGAVKAVAPGAIGRIVESGKPLFLNDHVTTDAKGHLQILLVDETVFTLGPDADIVLDKFVYNPDTGVGTVAAQIVRGAFRFVTGRIARLQPQSMKVRLNVGTIGIRGTVVVGETGEKGSTVINAGAGNSNDANEPPSAITVTNAGVTVGVFHTGEGVRFSRDGAPSNPAPMGADLDRISLKLGLPPSPKQASSKLPGGSPSDKSGRSTSRGWEYADLGAAFDQLNSNANGSEVAAVQNGLGIANGPAYWSDFALISGTGQYTGSGTYTCTGGLCGGGASGNANFTMNINFNTRQLLSGGGITLGTAGSFGGDSGSFSLVALPTSGRAILTLAGGTNFSNSSFNSTTFTFNNAGGVRAGETVMQLNYSGSSLVTGSGTVTGTR